MSTAEQDVPESVTLREVQEILRTFRDSDWSGMTVELHGMRITVGKHGPPTTVDRQEWSETRGERGSRSTTGDHAVEGSGAAGVRGGEGSTGGDDRREWSGNRAESGSRSTAGDHAAGGGTGGVQAPPADLAGCVAVASPAVGAFWVAPSPGQPPFVQVGDTVAQDQQLGIVEVMKLMNPVVSTVAGTVVQVCAANAELVEYEQTLFWIRPSDG